MSLVRGGLAVGIWALAAVGCGGGDGGGSPKTPTATHMVISQIYAGGGMTGATYTDDFVELFNPTVSTIDVTGWSVQYASATGNFNTRLVITSGSVPAHGYFLVGLSSGGANGNPLPPPDLSGVLSLPSSGGKVALVDITGGLLACGAALNSCTSTALIDLVGYGAMTSEYEGTGPAVYPGDSAQSAQRRGGGCVDEDSNDTDFAAGAVAARNSATATGSCP